MAEITYDGFATLQEEIERALASQEIGLEYAGGAGSDGMIVYTVTNGGTTLALTLGLLDGDELVNDGYDRAAAATPSGTYVVTTTPDDVRRRPEWVGWAENAPDALDRYSEDEDFAPYRDTEMRNHVYPYVLGHATVGAHAPFTNTTVFAICLHPDGGDDAPQ